MNQLAATKASAVAPFEPQRTKEEVAKSDALILMAKSLHNWPLLETAVDHKIEEQGEFVRWWRENVKRDGRPEKTSAGPRQFFVSDAESTTGITHQQVSKWVKRLADTAKYRDALYGAAYRKAMAERGQTDQRGASGTGENEWYTPEEYLRAAIDVMGAIDLDPASSEAAQKKVRAANYFTEATDGLKQEWHGRVWLNPPYAQPRIAQFVSKMVAEYRADRVPAGIMLTHNYTDTTWFHEAAGIADAICFTRGRVRFYNEKGEIAAPTQGQAFFYFGSDVAAFAGRFAKVGFVVTPFAGEV